MRVRKLSPPEAEPLSLAEAKQYLRISGNDDDAMITSLIIQSREYCEGYQNRRIPLQLLEAYMDRFPDGSIIIDDCSPVRSVTCISYTDMNGSESVVDSSSYSLDNVSFINKVDLLYGKRWPSTVLKPNNGVKISFAAGYEVIPESVKWAMILHIRLLYDDYKPDERERLEQARDSLLSMERVVPV